MKRILLVILLGFSFTVAVELDGYKIVLPGSTGSTGNVSTQTKDYNLISGSVTSSGFSSGSVVSSGNVSTGSVASTTGAITSTGTATTTSGVSLSGVVSNISGKVISGSVVQSGVVATGLVISSGVVNSGSASMLSGKSQVQLLSSGEDITQIVTWMYQNGISKFKTVNEFSPYDYLTREQAAKMFVMMQNSLGISSATGTLACDFVDLEKSDPSLKDFVTVACQRGLLKGDPSKRFLPIEQISKAQLTAVLIRLMEGKLSSEDFTPRWLLYFDKARTLGITKETDRKIYDRPVLRYEFALFLRRVKQLWEREFIRENALETLKEVEAKYSSTQQTISDGVVSVSAQDLPLSSDRDFNEALFWMYRNGITKYNNPEQFMPNSIVTREQGAEFLYDFSVAMNSTLGTGGSTGCVFSDVSKSSEFLVSITKLCDSGIIRGSNGKFFPSDPLLKSTFITMMVRYIDKKNYDGTGSSDWQQYAKRAMELGIINSSDLANPDLPLKRFEIAKYLYNLYVNSVIVSNLNSQKNQLQFIWQLAEPEKLVDGGTQVKIGVQSQLLLRGETDFVLVDILGTTYTIQKKSINNYVNNQNFVRYGTVFSSETDKPVGTATFIVSNGAVIDGTIRFTVSEVYYMIVPAANSMPYYYLTEKKLTQ